MRLCRTCRSARTVPDEEGLRSIQFCHRDLHPNTGRVRGNDGHRLVTSPCNAGGNGNLVIGVLGAANPGSICPLNEPLVNSVTHLIPRAMAMSLKALFGKKEKRPAKKPESPSPQISRGSFLVTAASSVRTEFSSQPIWMTGVLTGPRLNPCALLYNGRANSKKWPEVGQTLPVTMDHSVPNIVKVLWDEVPDPKDVGLERAKTIVDSMNLEARQGSISRPDI